MQSTDAALKPYFELQTVVENGVFYTMQQLYGVTFRERTDLPVYTAGVKTYDVFDDSGSKIGLFYTDYLQRDGKSGGAWMDQFDWQSLLLQQKPVVLNVLNIPPPAPGNPTLVSFDHVTTLFS